MYNQCMNRVVALLALGLMSAADAWSAQAGRVQFVNGDVEVTTAAGATRVAQKGDAINEGDTVTSAKAASAQIKMQDGGFIAVRSDTQLKFDSFKFSGKEDDKEDNSFFSLFKGGFRAVTGLIGRVNKQNYKVTTPVATIGIRGTDHETVMVLPDNPLVLARGAEAGAYNKVNTGETSITTDKGTINVLPNQMGFAGGLDQMPQIKPININLFTVAPTPAPGAKMDEGKGEGKGGRDTAVVDNTTEAAKGAATPANNGMAAGNNANVLQNVAPPAVVIVPPVVAASPSWDGVQPAQGSTLGVIIMNTSPTYGGQETWGAGSRLLQVNNDASGILTIVNWCWGCTYPNVARVALNGVPAASIFNAGADMGVVEWGRWSGGMTTFGGWGPIQLGTDQGFAFVAGFQTAVLPTTAVTARYNILGATAPTNNLVAGLTTGPTVSATGYLDVNFASQATNLQMGVASGNANFQIAGTGTGFSGSGFTMAGTTTLIGGTAPFCTTGCPTNMVGSFYGVGATHAGVAYRANASYGGGGVIDGAAVFKK